jgi:uncharacterized membrane protein YphA (DoxX/SURF4 family)
MKAILVLRLTLGITFLWIGFLILQHPDAWAQFLQDYFVKVLPFSTIALMTFTAYLDMTLGVLLLLNLFTPYVGIIGTIHMIAILISSGITDVTVRDIAIGGACFALFLLTKEKSIFKNYLK